MVMTVDQRNTWRPTLNSAVEAPVLHLLDKLLQARLLVETGDFLEQLPTPYPTDADADADEASAPGRIIAGYELIELLGQGGMGSVWKARYADQRLQRQVAVKLPRWREAWQEDSSQHLHQRMARERDILTALDHPNIARLLDAGVSEDGQPYLVLEWVDGQVLDAYADQQQLSIAQRLSLMLQVLEAVDHAHRHLVLHRDIKPANILVNDEGQVKLLDFGVAKLLPSEEELAPSQEDSLTRAQAPALTLAYASPEQLRREPLSTASDVYACGVLLYRLLTGHLPYKPSRDSRAALEEAILTGQTQSASRAGFDEAASRLRGLAPSALSRLLHGDLDTLLSTALKPQALDRYASAKAMAQDIERYLRQEPLQARGDSAWYITRRWVQRHRWPVAAGVLVTTVVLASGGVAFQQARRAEAQAQSAQQASQRSAAAQQFLGGILALTDPEKNLGVGEYDHQLLDHAFQTAVAQFRRQPDTIAEVLQQLGEIYRRQGMRQQLLAVQKERWRLVSSAPELAVGLRLEAQAELGWALSENSESEQAQDLLQAAATMARDPQLSIPAATRVRALVYWANELSLQERHPEALVAAKESLVWAQQGLKNPHPVLALAHQAVAGMAANVGDAETSRREFEAADAIDRTGQGRGPVDQITTLILWAGLEYGQAQYSQARALALQALQRGGLDVGASGELLTPARMWAIHATERTGDVAKAQELVDRLLTEDRRSDDAFRRARALYMQAVVALTARKQELCFKALQDASEGLNQSPYWQAMWKMRLASAWLVFPKHAASTEAASARIANQYAREALTFFDPGGRGQGRNFLQTLERLGVSQARLGDVDAARASFERACQWPRGNLASSHPDRLRCEAYVLLAQEQRDPAENADRLAQLLSQVPTGMPLQAAMQRARDWMLVVQTKSHFQEFPFLD